MVIVLGGDDGNIPYNDFKFQSQIQQESSQIK